MAITEHIRIGLRDIRFELMTTLMVGLQEGNRRFAPVAQFAVVVYSHKIKQRDAPREQNMLEIYQSINQSLFVSGNQSP